MVSLSGGCNKCGRWVTVDCDDYSDKPTIICRSCYEKYYSPETIRNQKLKKPFWKRIFYFL